MERKELIRRYLFFIVAVLVNSFAIAVITKALLGTSPISSIPYVLSLGTPVTMGVWTIWFSLLLIVGACVLMGWRETKRRWLELLAQVPITLCFGAFIDVSMVQLLWWLEPVHYWQQVAALLVGCFILGSGVAMEVKADVAMVAGEYFVSALSKRIRKDFALVKVCFDWGNVAIAACLSGLLLGRLAGIREGTLVAALLVGPISHLVFPWLRVFDGFLTAQGNPEKPSIQRRLLRRLRRRTINPE